MKYFWFFIIALFLLLLIYILDVMYNGPHYIYREEIKGAVYDKETRLPVGGVEIAFIHDTLTIAGSSGENNINEGKNYYTDKDGIFKIPEIKGRYQSNSPFIMNLSCIVTVSYENYITDTLNLYEWKQVYDKPTFDTIWIKPIHNQIHEIELQ